MHPDRADFSGRLSLASKKSYFLVAPDVIGPGTTCLWATGGCLSANSAQKLLLSRVLTSISAKPDRAVFSLAPYASCRDGFVLHFPAISLHSQLLQSRNSKRFILKKDHIGAMLVDFSL
jgi:hypothetical protein